MNALSKEIIDKYMIRQRYKQKTLFISLIKDNLENVSINENNKGKFLKSRNIVVGDINNASVIYTAHYDTPARLPFPNFISANKFVYFLYQIILALIIVIPILFFLGLFSNLYSNFIDFLLEYIPSSNSLVHLVLNISATIFPIIVAISLLLLTTWLILAAVPNKNNFNDNTSGVITLIETYFAMSEEQRKKALFIFFDNEEKGVLGSAFFKKQYNEVIKDKLLLNFDCVSDGDNILYFQKRKEDKYNELLEKSFIQKDKKVFIKKKGFYPSDNKHFNNSYGIGAYNKKKILSYYFSRIHTNRDTKFDFSNIELLKDININIINNI